MSKSNTKLSLLEEMVSGDYTNLKPCNAKVLHVKSVISEEQLESWYDLYGFDCSKYVLFILEDAEKVIDPPEGTIAIYQVQLDLDVRFPMDEFVVLALHRYNLTFAQLLPNASMLLNGFVGRARCVGVPHGVSYCEYLLRIFRSNYEVVSRSDDIGRFSFRTKSSGIKIFADMGRHSHLPWENKYVFLKSTTDEPLPINGKFKVLNSSVNKKPGSYMYSVEMVIQEAMTDWSSVNEDGEPMTLEAFLTSYLEVNYGGGNIPPVLTENSPNWKRIDLKAKEILEKRKKKDAEKAKKSKKVASLIVPPVAVVETTITKKWRNTGNSVAFKRHLSYGKKYDHAEGGSVQKKMKNNEGTSTVILDDSENLKHTNEHEKVEKNEENGCCDSTEEIYVPKESSASKTSKINESISEKTVKEELLKNSSPNSKTSGDASHSDPIDAPTPATPTTPAVDTSTLDPTPLVPSIPASGVVMPTFVPSSSSIGVKPTYIVVDEDRVNHLLNLIASSKKGEKGKKVQRDDGFSSLPIDVLIAKVAKLQLIQLESAEEFKVLSQELVSRLFVVNAVMNHEMQISAQLQEDVIKYKMMADRFALLTPQRTEESALEAQNCCLIAEVEVMKLKMKKMEAAMIEKDLQDKV